MAASSDFGPSAVFVNAPFDRGYEPLFVTLIGTLVFLGQEPHCVVELPEKVKGGRLQRIFDLLASCRISIHDLSRQGPPPRLNMPFELGLACSLSLGGGPHEVVVLEAESYRLDRTLSDYKGRDPLVHHNRCDEIVTCLLDAFSAAGLPSAPDLRRAARDLRATAGALKRVLDIPTIFRAAAFRSLVEAATEIATARGFVAAERT